MSLLCAICPHSCTSEKTSRSITHLKITLGQALLNRGSFEIDFQKRRCNLLSILSTLLRLGLGYHTSASEFSCTYLRKIEQCLGFWHINVCLSHAFSCNRQRHFNWEDHWEVGKKHHAFSRSANNSYANANIRTLGMWSTCSASLDACVYYYESINVIC